MNKDNTQIGWLKIISAWLLPLPVLFIQWLFWESIKPHAYFLLFPTFLLASFIGGFWGGAGASVIGAFLAFVAFTPPEMELGWNRATDPFSALVVLITGIAVSYLQDRLKSRDHMLATALAKAKAESENHANLQRLSALINQKSAGFVEVDLEGRLLNVNERFCELIGYAREELLGRSLLHITVPEDIPLERQVIPGLIINKKTVFFEKRYRHKNGTTVYATLAAAAVTDPKGDTKSLVALVMDSTQRVIAEGKLRENEIRLRLATEAVGLGTWEWDLVNNKARWSDLLRNLFGIPSTAEVTPETYETVVDPQHLTRIRDALSQSIGERKDLKISFPIVRPDGSRRWVYCVARVFCDRAGVPENMRGVVLDITEQKQTEEALRALNNHLELAKEAAGLGVWEWTPKDDHYSWSPEMFKLLGVDSATASASMDTWKSAVLPEDLPGALARLEAALSSGNRIVNPYRVLRRGKIHWLVAIGRGIYEADGSLLRVTGICMDVTEQKELQGELSLKNQELLRAVRTKDEFLATMTHELRTPLTSILLRAEAVSSGVYGPITLKQAAAIQGIEKSGLQLLDLVNDVLDFARSESGQLPLKMEVFDVEQMTDQLAMDFENTFSRKNQRFEVLLDDRKLRISADPRRLKQMLSNLLDNAAKFTPEGGCVKLLVAKESGEELVRFTVEDTGIGIAQEDMPKLFQPFVQLDSSLSRAYEGSGLGLSLVHKLVEAHGGRVELDSKIGQGSRFSLVLPLTTKSTALPADAYETRVPIPKQESATGCAPSPLILIAEDNEETLSAVSDYLQSQGYSTVLARNGEEAVEKAKACKPDVIVMDIQMPKLDGWKATRLLRKSEGFAHTPIIALTALMLQGNKEIFLEAGTDAVLAKPCKLQMISQSIREQLACKKQPLTTGK